MSAELAFEPGLPGHVRTRHHLGRGTEPTDGELIVRVGEGDSGAFEQLYQRYARSVFGLALRRLGDRGRAEDAVQETFTSIWRSATSYRSDRGPGGPWLYAVARNAIVDRRPRTRRAARRARRRRRPSDAGPARTRRGWLDGLARAPRARGAPGSASELIELAYWGGLSQSEIADFVGIPLGTVKTRTRSALSRLADVLEGELVSDPPKFHELVGEGLPPSEAERLERVHEMLVVAGPPPELPPELEEAPDARGNVRELSRRGSPAAASARRSHRSRDRTARVRRRIPGRVQAHEQGLRVRSTVALTNTQAQAVVRIGPRDANGNTPMSSRSRACPKLPEHDYYVLYMTKGGKPVGVCGSFDVRGPRSTTLRFPVAYDPADFDGLQIARWEHSDHRPCRWSAGRSARAKSGRSRRTPRT